MTDTSVWKLQGNLRIQRVGRLVLCVCVYNEYTMNIMNKHSIEVWFAQIDDSEKRKLRENRCRDRYR